MNSSKYTSMKDLMGKIMKEEKIDNFSNSKESLRQKLYEIKKRLKIINIDLTKFGMKKEETLKLIYMIYSFEKVHKINLILLLKNATLENVDNSCLKNTNNLSVNINTEYGETISSFKEEILEELNPNFKCNSNNLINETIHEWNCIISSLKTHLVQCVFNDKVNEFDRILNYIQKIYNKLNLKSDIDYEHNIFETIYLYIKKGENVGREKDLILIQKMILEKIQNNNFEVEDYYIRKYKTLLNTLILKNNINKYINENIDLFTELVLMKKNITNDDKKDIQFIIPFIIQLLNIIEEGTNYNFGNGVNLTLIITCAQEILICKNTKEKYAPHYFKSKVKPKSIFSVLKKPKDFEDIFKIIWIKKVDAKFYINLGMNNELKKFYNIENSLDKIILKILSLHNMEDIKIVNNLISDFVKTSLITDNIAIDMLNKFTDKLNAVTGYKTYIKTPNALNFFKIIDDENLKLELINNIFKYINDTKKKDILQLSYKIPIEFNRNDFILIITIKNYYKIIEFTYFVSIHDEILEARLKRLGLDKFIGNDIVQKRILENSIKY